MESLQLCGLLLIVLQLGCLLNSTPTIMVTATPAKFDYGDALHKSLLFFEAQRSGYLPGNQRVQWRGDSGLKDGYEQQVDLVGGYYDAGDHVKFGLPMAYTVTIISWAAVDFRREIVAAKQMDHTLDAIRWGTDYFLKAHCEPNVLWAQVGDGEEDHSCWQRAEEMTTSRKALRLDSGSPGSDVAAETAAALAAASLAFKSYNSSYAALLVRHAKQLFSFADTFRGHYDDSYPDVEAFYPSSGYSDELLWAAAWLYRATNNNYYLEYASFNGAELGGTGNGVKIFSWDNKYAGLQVLLTKVMLDGDGKSYNDTLKRYKEKADYFTCAYLQKNNGYNVAKTPGQVVVSIIGGGLVFLMSWSNLQYVTSASFLLAIYSDYLDTSGSVVDCPDGEVQPQELLDFAKSQADYILGKNPESMSYLIGYGTKYPQKPHHRGSSMPSLSELSSKLGCVQGFEEWYKKSSPNPNILYGALVGGPDSSDCYTDDRDNYEQSEPTLTAAAPLIGLFSKLYSLSSPSSSGYSSSTSPESSGPYQDSSTPSASLESVPKSASTETPLQSSSVQHSSAPVPGPASRPGYLTDAPGSSPEADYVLVTQPINSASPSLQLGHFQYLLMKAMIFLMPFLAVL